ncbi:MAG: hypothetical protein OXH03_03720 [Bacteroidetes bacterium]|nr:hypothetical protein [Bacteroidota bacterium]MDE2672295.1 hypothetical protein [Bacteroidota bacterium]
MNYLLQRGDTSDSETWWRTRTSQKSFVVARLLKLIQPEITAILWGPVEDPPFTVKADGGLIRGRQKELSDDGQIVASRSRILNAHKSKVRQSNLAAWSIDNFS